MKNSSYKMHHLIYIMQIKSVIFLVPTRVKLQGRNPKQSHRGAPAAQGSPCWGVCPKHQQCFGDVNWVCSCVWARILLYIAPLKRSNPFLCVTGIMYRKSCASSAACLIASAGYQSFCSPGKVNSVCISCCNTPLCNGPRPKKRGSSAVVPRAHVVTTLLLLKFALLFLYC